MRQKIFDEIKARTKETDLSVPTRRGDWWYYGRSFEGKQYNVHCRCPVSDPEDWSPPVLDEQTEIPGEQVLIDENVEAEGHDFFALGAAGVSLDGNILAYSEDTKGDERYTLRFKDLRTGALYDDQIVGIGAGVTWAADNRTVYYTTVDDAWRPDTIWRHRIGSGAAGRARLPRTRREVLAGGRAHPQRQVHHHRGGQRRHLGGPLRRRRRQRRRSSPRYGRAASSSSTRSNTPSSAARTASSSCTTTARRTSRSSMRRWTTPPPSAP